VSGNATERYVDGFADARASLPGGGRDWVASLRQSGIDRFAELGLPTARQEAWKYTRLTALERSEFVLPAAADADVPTLDALLLGADAHRMVFVNGRFRADLSDLARLPAGARVSSLAAALEAGDAALRQALADVAGEADPFVALNTAYMGGGVLLELADGCVLDAPLQLLFVAGGGAEYINHVRNVVLAGANSQATVFEAYACPDGGSYFTNACTELRLAPGAQVEHVRLQDEDESAFHIGRVRADVGRDASYRSRLFSLGAQLARSDIDVRLATGAECDLDGLYLAHRRQHVDHQTRVDHAEPNARSSEYYKGILDDAARAIFAGSVIVRKDAQKSDARQMNRNLLLSPRAEVDTKPQLEIYADDVKCTHGATVGQLDPVEMFYLRTRGLDETAARQLLIHAFANDLVDRVADAAVRRLVYRAIDARLPGRESATGLDA
jgi:Fe-S cluster assembly protein SufD